MTKIDIADLMSDSNVGFGTSGVRGLVEQMTDKVCYAYTTGFLKYLKENHVTGDNRQIAIAGDLRTSTDRIIKAVMQAAIDMQVEPIYCGKIPSPAVALFGLQHAIPSIMVTGSHIPDDRNGIKFNLATGEISKQDEIGIKSQSISIDETRFDTDGMLINSKPLPSPNTDAKSLYVARYTQLFGNDSLMGMQVGIYQHSGVARDLLMEILQQLGAEVTALCRSDIFVPVDTEAIRNEDIKLAKDWIDEHGFDSIISTDGDADRPLVSDELGNWLRGDTVGSLCAHILGAEHVVTPVSSNTAVDKSGWFSSVERTRIGSPYVIEGMEKLAKEGKNKIVGYEANGGFLIYNSLKLGNKTLTSLPTRDAVIAILNLLTSSRQRDLPLSELAAELPSRFTYSDRIKNIPTEKSQALLKGFDSGNTETDQSKIASFFDQQFGSVISINRTDGLRMTFESGQIIHLRPSGNAPELRCYSEADTLEKAVKINQQALDFISTAVS